MSRGRTHSESDFIGRWSRLKRERATSLEVDADQMYSTPTQDAAAGSPAPDAAAQAPKSDADILAELGLPDPETLTGSDDFTAFMTKAVPEHLRRAALRRLWVSKPIFSACDGLIDYADDYTDAAVAVGKLATSYTVGRGFMTEEEILPPRGHPEHQPEVPVAASASAETADPEDAPWPDGGSDAPGDDGSAVAEASQDPSEADAIGLAQPADRVADAVDPAPEAPGGAVAPSRARIRFRLTDS
ncbi:MAG: DUF3306 domain-containing protein [Thermohalobaculum sp.]|nr:DUF3306 domain-containing protein [Thermohalobaculum sp.]